ncbi:MAG: hypothetical protein L6R41_006293 [Letrouitia leprolyta]|nr:MAG: hypothetical protein L6R41_006293 [Letrouitia leprolyta]
MPKVSSTPQPDHQIISLTPGKKSATPSQAYAGPTFHASPAASSLPMPRFFSKSVPEVNKDVGAQSATEKEITESSSEQTEGSPTPAFARRNVEEPVREESPLDIFFKADKEQRERERRAREAHIGDPVSISPVGEIEQLRHHSCHSTNGSMGALFPLELENQEPVKISHEKAFSDPMASASDRSNSGLPTTQILETAEQIEQRKAKTIALKELLLSSVPSKSEFTPSTEHVDPPNHGISKPQAQKRASASHIHKQIAAQTAQQLSHRPRPSSSLRKELSASALPDERQIPELPATPTPLRTHNAHKSVPIESRTEPSFDSTSSPSPAPSSSKRITPIPDVSGCSNPYKTMEDDLRRILKLNVLPNDGEVGVRS